MVFASSGCVYPNFLQSDVNKEVFLTEDLTKGPNDADNTYGWAKLMGEFTLQAYARSTGWAQRLAATSPCTVRAASKITPSSP